MNRLDSCEHDHEEPCRLREFYKGSQAMGEKILEEIRKEDLESEVPDEILDYIDELTRGSNEEVKELDRSYDLENLDFTLRSIGENEGEKTEV